MDVTNQFIETTKIKIQNNSRGEISYYSINQVADLLNEDLSNIKYYTNIFDDILKIEIVNKELQYNNEDVNKLEFLMKLKKKGMTIKEIHEYYNKISFDEDEVKEKTTNLISVQDLINNVIEAEAKHFSKLREDILIDIKKNNSEYIKDLTNVLIESQEKQLTDFKENLTQEIKEYIDSNLKLHNENSLEIQNNIINKTTEFISEKIDIKNAELTVNLNNSIETLSKESIEQGEHLSQEIQSFKRIIHNAYYVDSQIHKESSNDGFFSKLFSIFSN